MVLSLIGETSDGTGHHLGHQHPYTTYYSPLFRHILEKLKYMYDKFVHTTFMYTCVQEGVCLLLSNSVYMTIAEHCA